MSGEVLLEIENYPSDGDDSIIREVAFGPASTDFALLIEVNPFGGPMRLTIGNGPRDADLPRLLPEVLHDMASAVDNLADSDEFWEQITRS